MKIFHFKAFQIKVKTIIVSVDILLVDSQSYLLVFIAIIFYRYIYKVIYQPILHCRLALVHP